MQRNLNGSVAIVTGAGRGTGAAVARALALAGARVTVNDVNPDRTERMAQEITRAGGEALAVQADVSNKFQCVKLVEATRARWGQLDILVNAAHIRPRATVLKMDEWDWNRCLEVNVKGVFFMSQLCGRVMDDSKRGGTIVNLISEAGVEIPLEDHAAFCASQAAVLGFARECAREFADYGVQVHTLVHGAAGDQEADEASDRHEQIAHAVLALWAGDGQTHAATPPLRDLEQG
ncbi:MAG TPA: SDR family NAD(P)-dependent oxidoreductase [Candidatus Binatia bacterium]|nr:SDR family NAD(P)-dependent oxidoreductase [Candidatus Binatia bacterium]